MSTDANASVLKEKRLAAGMSQWDLALAAGVPEKTISRLEAGAHGPRLSTAQALARALGIGVDELFPQPEEAASA